MDRAWVPLWGKSEKTEPSPFFLPDWVNFSSKQCQLCEKEGSFFFGNTGYLWTLCMRLGNCLHFHWKCIFVKVLLSSFGALYVIMLQPTIIQPPNSFNWKLQHAKVALFMNKNDQWSLTMIRAAPYICFYTSTFTQYSGLAMMIIQFTPHAICWSAPTSSDVFAVGNRV